MSTQKMPKNPDTLDKMADVLSDLIMGSVPIQNAATDWAWNVMNLPDPSTEGLELSHAQMNQMVDLQWEYYQAIADRLFAKIAANQ